MTLPPLLSYSEQEMSAACAAWPAVDRYRQLLTRTPSTAAEELRLKRHQAWLQCALALFHTRASDADVCLFWSLRADEHIRQASRLSGLDKTQSAIFALGKLGAEELNLSSDVDLIVVVADGQPPPIKEARHFVKILAEIDAWGFCHRVDMDLRPGGSSSTLVPTYSQYENHFGYHGETWERLAGIRMRAIDGDANVIKSVMSFAKGFSYRRHLDYSVFEELRLLLNRIRAENPQNDPRVFDLKIHPGGIRDIELLVHALQAIHGGRIPTLQVRSTSAAIEALAKNGLLNAGEAKTLHETYWYYRGLENRLQAENDEQTYRWTGPMTMPEIRAHAEAIQKISKAAFPESKSTATASATISHDGLVQRGYSGSVVDECLEELKSTKVLSKKSERDEREKDIFLTSFLEALEASGGNLDLGLARLVDFVKSTRAKATLFSMLNREPALVRQLAKLFGVSPWAAQILISRPELLDSFILRQESTNHVADLEPDLALEALAERKLLGELVAVRHFLENRDLDECVGNLTDLADSIATDLMLVTAREIGIPPLGIVALGKWGGCELGLRSDLDFVFTTSTKATTDQQRLARRFLNRLSEQHRGGSMYQFDLRLRPSGQAGPILVEHTQLKEHLKTKAEAWERQSWLRARSLERLPHVLDESVLEIILDRALSEEDDAELTRIATQLLKPIEAVPKSSSTIGSTADAKAAKVDIKLCHGGLAAIEFAAQIAILRMGRKPWSKRAIRLETSTHGMIHFLEGCDSTWQKHGPWLRKTHSWLRDLEQWQQVTGDVSGSKLKVDSAELAAEIQSTLVESNARLDELLGR